MPKGRQCVPAAVNDGVWVRTFRPNKLHLLFSFAPPPPQDAGQGNPCSKCKEDIWFEV